MASSTPETVLVLGKELEQRLAAAARLCGLDLGDFIVRAVQRGVAEALGEPGETGRFLEQPSRYRPGGAPHAPRGGWAIRPTQSLVVRSVAELTGLSIETIVSDQRSSAAAIARAVTAYLLQNDVGFSTLDTARVLHLKTNTVTVLIASIEGVIGTADPRAQLIERTRNACSRMG